LLNIKDIDSPGENPMDLPLSLTLEQQFNLKMYESQVRHMSAEQSQDLLLEVMRQLMVKENIVKHLMKAI
jgi:hypothetical protein